MKRVSALAVIACVVCIWNVGYSAQEQTPDKRLEQKVTVKAMAYPLGDFLAELSSKTGVKMTARKDVADDKLVVLVKDLPLSKLRDAIKEVLHLQCTRSGKESEWKYEFWMDLKTKQDIERLKQEERRKLKSYVEGLVDKADRLAEERLRQDGDESASDESAAAEERLSSRGQGLLALVIGPPAIMYRYLSREQLTGLWSGGKISIDVKQAPADFQKKLLATQSVWITLAGDDEAEAEVLSPERVDRVVYWLEEDKDSNRLGLNVCTYSQQTDPDTGSRGRVSLMIAIELPGEERDEETADQEDESDVAWEDDDVESEAEDGKTPAEPAGLTPYQVMERLSEDKHLSIVSDYFTRLTSRRLGGEVLKAEAGALLKEIARKLESDLTEKDEARLLVTRIWYRNRQREIPERLVKRWRSSVKENKGYRLQDALELAQLSVSQLNDLHIYGLGDGSKILHCREALKLAAALDPRQWEAALGKDGLPMYALTEMQFQLVLDWAEARAGFSLSDRQEGQEELTPEALRQGTLRMEAPSKPESGWEFHADADEIGVHLMSNLYLRALSEGVASAESDSQVSNGAAKQKIIEPTCEISVKSASEPWREVPAPSRAAPYFW